MRDSFGGGPLNMGQNQNTGDRNEDYSQDPMGLKRKRSFTGTTTSNSTSTGAYGTTT